MDWAYIPKKNIGPRFENMVAVYLLRLVHVLNENGLGDYKLHFVRDLSMREVDFVITEGSELVLLRVGMGLQHIFFVDYKIFYPRINGRN